MILIFWVFFLISKLKFCCCPQSVRRRACAMHLFICLGGTVGSEKECETPPFGRGDLGNEHSTVLILIQSQDLLVKVGLQLLKQIICISLQAASSLGLLFFQSWPPKGNELLFFSPASRSQCCRAREISQAMIYAFFHGFSPLLPPFFSL